MSDVRDRMPGGETRTRLLEGLLTRLEDCREKAQEGWECLKASLVAGASGPELAGMEKALRAILEEQEQLAAALVGVHQGIEEFAEDFLTHYSPQQIDKAARMEKKRFAAINTARWKKYQELTGDWTRQSLAEKIESKVFRVVEHNQPKPPAPDNNS